MSYKEQLKVNALVFMETGIARFATIKLRIICSKLILYSICIRLQKQAVINWWI
jgi:hypothetical protein